MFEIVVFCVILFAIAYWTTLFIMGRREDVLHGEFVETEPESRPPLIAVPTDLNAAETAPAPAPIVIADPAPAALPMSAPVSVVAPTAIPRPAPANKEKLQSLLASIKQELKNAAQI